MLTRIAGWFTPARRQAVQIFFGSLAPFAILFGFGTDGIWEQLLIISGASLQFLSSILSLVNLRRGDWGTGFTVVRGALYTLAATVSPALVLLGLYSPETSATILLALSLGLGALSNLTAIFVGKQQELSPS